MPMLVGLAAFAAIFSAPSSASDVHCPPHLGAVEVDGDLLVAAACRLEGTRVKGNVRVFSGGSLHGDRASIEGNLEAERADFVTLSRTTVDGNVDLDELVGDRSAIALSDIDGNIRLRNNRSALDFEDNRVDGNVRVERNRGGVWIAGNVVEGNLDCRGNSPAPTGRANRVSGSTRGQCRELQPVQAEAPDPVEEEPAEEEPAQPPAGPIEPPAAENEEEETPAEPDESPAPAPGGSTGSNDTGGGSASGGLALDPQPSGGGGSLGARDVMLLLALLGLLHARRRFAEIVPGRARTRLF